MTETLLSLDKDKQIARQDLPLPKAAKPELHSLAVTAVSIIFLLAFVLLVWIVISLVRSDSGLDTVLPFISSGEKAHELRLD